MMLYIHFVPSFMKISKECQSFYPQTERFGRFSDEPGVRPSECPSVNIFMSALELENRLEYFDDAPQLCRTDHDDVSRTKKGVLASILF